MRFTLKNLRFLQYIDYQNVRKTEFLGCQSQESQAYPDKRLLQMFEHNYVMFIIRGLCNHLAAKLHL